MRTIKFDVNVFRKPKFVNKLLKMIIFLYNDLGLLEHFNVCPTMFVRFLLTVHQMYRNVHYHSFYHAFDTTHFMYLQIRMLMKPDTPEEQRLTKVEQYAAMVTALLHDVEHMGLNNTYHLKADTPMGIVCSLSGIPSVLETHHCNRAIQVRSPWRWLSKGNQIPCTNDSPLPANASQRQCCPKVQNGIFLDRVSDEVNEKAKQTALLVQALDRVFCGMGRQWLDCTRVQSMHAQEQYCAHHCDVMLLG